LAHPLFQQTQLFLKAAVLQGEETAFLFWLLQLIEGVGHGAEFPAAKALRI
jgi:hypothetical protein